MRIFWDTNLFIYLWERRHFAAEMDALCSAIESGGHSIVTSSLTLGEILVQPLRLGRPETAARYQEVLSRFEIIEFNTPAAIVFARLRATHPTLRPPDAIQLACAVVGRCEAFLTNDDRLSSLDIKEIPQILPAARWHELN